MKSLWILLGLGTAMALSPFVYLLWLTTDFDPYPADPTERIANASLGIKESYSYPPASDLDVLTTAAEAGNATAQNNLAVLYTRTGRPGDAEKADQLFELATQQGLIQARYNLALRLPHKFDTDPTIIRRQLDLLEANVQAGDVHSMALMAARLYFVNRDDYVGNRLQYRMTLLETAALSGDREYMYQYGDQIWDDHRSSDAADVETAVDILLQAHDLGENRAANKLGAMLSHRDRQLVIPHLLARNQSASALVWYDRAAQQGLRAAACAYGRHVFPSTARTNDPDTENSDEMIALVADLTANYPQRTIDKAIAHMNDCATPRQRTQSAIRIFGDDALYLRKMRGSWPGTHGWPEHADTVLGLLAAYGPKPDMERAHFHFERSEN